MLLSKATDAIKQALPTLYGLLAALIILGLLTLIFSAVVYFTELSEALLRPGGIVISVLALLCGGFIAGRKGQNQGIWRGLSLGLLYLLILYLVAAASGNGGQILLPKAGYIILAAVIGGICGVK